MLRGIVNEDRERWKESALELDGGPSPLNSISYERKESWRLEIMTPSWAYGRLESAKITHRFWF